jgi:hypothetical protein
VASGEWRVMGGGWSEDCERRRGFAVAEEAAGVIDVKIRLTRLCGDVGVEAHEHVQVVIDDREPADGDCEDIQPLIVCRRCRKRLRWLTCARRSNLGETTFTSIFSFSCCYISST